MFQHHDGRVRIVAPGTDGMVFREAEFAAIEPAFTGLPAGFKSRRYDPAAKPGRPRHVLVSDDDAQRGGPEPWPEGDAILARAGEYKALHAAAFPPPATPPPPKPEEVVERQAAADPVVRALIGEIAEIRGETEDAVVARLKERARALKTQP